VGNDEEKNVSPHNLIKAEAYEWVVKWRTIFLRGPGSAGGCNLSKWKVGGLQIIVSGLESGGGRPKDRTESEGQALREDGKWGSIFQKWQKIKKKMSFGFKHAILSFALMMISMLYIQLFLSVFQKRGRSKIIVLHPLFSRFWKWGICPFTSSTYAMENMVKLIYINSI
jgi:hypothetical protein